MNALVPVAQKSWKAWTKFLLIQGNKILDTSYSPAHLNWFACDSQADIIVAAGVFNEYGTREIAGVVGRYCYTPFAKTFRLYSNGTLIRETPVSDPVMLMKRTIERMFNQGSFDDPANLPTITLEGEGQTRKSQFVT